MYNGTMKRGKIMTRDKAIEEVKNYENYPNGLSKECRDYIVKALEQVPSSLENPNLSENPISSITKNGISNRTIIYKAKESKDIQEDLEKLEKLNEPTTKNCKSCKNYGSHNEVCKYCYKCSLWTEIKPTTKSETLVSLDVYNQVAKERDMAIQQLHDLGYELGITIPDIKYHSHYCVDRRLVEALVHRYLEEATDNHVAFYEELLDLPLVTPIRPKGHWIDKFGGVYRCSVCREIISIDTVEFPNGITYKYCPYCGSNNSVEIEKEE